MKKSLALLAVAALGLAACGDDDADGVSVSNAWARTSPMSASVGALYMNIESGADDQLLAVTVDPSVAARTEIHETVAADDMNDGMDEGMDEGMDNGMDEGDMHGGGMMTMREIASLELPAGDQVELRPGGYHVMLLDLASPLVVGESFDATLVFAGAESVTVTVEIRDEAP